MTLAMDIIDFRGVLRKLPPDRSVRSLGNRCKSRVGSCTLVRARRDRFGRLARILGDIGEN